MKDGVPTYLDFFDWDVSLEHVKKKSLQGLDFPYMAHQMEIMAKKVYEMTDDEKQLYKELKQEVLKANQRIRKLNKLGIEEPFAVKQLHDYLGSSYIKAITPAGYISLKGGYNVQQLTGIKRATEDFLSDVSTMREINKLKKEYESKLGKEIDLRQVNTLYEFENTYYWIYDYIPKSEFWDEWAPLAVEIDSESWIEQIGYRIGDIPDVDLREKLQALYIYVTRE